MSAPADAFCAILAAGRGERFGGGKLMADLGGRPLLTWAVEAALGSGLGRVLVVLGQEAKALAALLPADPRLEVLLNPRHQEGMGTSLALAAARASEAGAAALAVLLGDMPLASPFVLAAVALAAVESPAGLAAASAEGRRGHPVAFGVRHFPALVRLSGDQGGRRGRTRGGVHRHRPGDRTVRVVQAGRGRAVGGAVLRRVRRRRLRVRDAPGGRVGLRRGRSRRCRSRLTGVDAPPGEASERPHRTRFSSLEVAGDRIEAHEGAARRRDHDDIVGRQRRLQGAQCHRAKGRPPTSLAVLRV